MRILVTGSRTWRDPVGIAAALDAATVDHPGRHVLVHGAAAGADRAAAAHATRRGWLVEAYPADWRSCAESCQPGHRRTNARGEYCPTAGHRRNAAMVAAGADLCVAFIRNGSPGATGCAALAEDAGIPVERHRKDDR
ncbi:SLOG family protein [Cryptosporangium aurantiacum]|uniref:YspA cpYpsA-related SLOG domain-containing protein n=1 Tax=Cryptosporangium aurantiacum TaxID=134849 RepID=A0A1M7RJU7_9ACTN|nr:SLOG family protein [Cryptosporangium aurantiacum]SHN46442.1 Protein of unknown function [Cryptosporangium aurantiacum]